MNQPNIISHNGDRVITKEDLIKMHNIDEQLYELIRFTANVWEQASKDKDGGNTITQLHQIKAEFKPIHPLVDYREVLIDIFKDCIPKHNDVIKNQSQGDILAVLVHTDKHIDRIEHNHKYLKQINDRTQELMHQIKKRDIEKFVYSDLGDLFNSNTNYSTKNQTLQRNNMSESDSFKLGMQNEIFLINKMIEEFGGVEAVYVSGNHDQDKHNWMAQALNLYFSNHPNVEINDKDEMRKYIDYGKNVIGLQHGHLVPWNRALETFSSEHKMRDNNYLLQGHIHHEYAKQYGKLLVQSLGSPAKPSNREKENGYGTEGNIKAMLFDKKKGRIATLEG